MLLDLVTILVAEAGSAGSGLSPRAVAQGGVTLGSCLAIVCSWHRNRSILWAIVAGFLTWIYVIYFAVTRRDDERK